MKYAVAKAPDAELWSGLFDSVEEATLKGPTELSLDRYEKEFFIAEAHVFQPFISALDVLEQLEDNCQSECGEASDTFSPCDAGKEAVDELEYNLNAVLTAWLVKNGETPTCYTVSNVRRCDLSASGWELK